MVRRRITLEGLAESERPGFLAAVVQRYAQALKQQFPSVQGYLISSVAPGVWRVTRGRFWGLEVGLVSQDPAVRQADLKFEAFFPIVLRYVDPVKSFYDRLEQMTALRKHIVFHIFAAFLFLPLLLAIPLLVAYRMALLSLSADLRAAADQLDSLWPQMVASRAGAVVLSTPRPPALTYFLCLSGAAAATSGCFWLAGQPGPAGTWSTVLIVAGAILALPSVILLLALVLTSLGFEAGK